MLVILSLSSEYAIMILFDLHVPLNYERFNFSTGKLSKGNLFKTVFLIPRSKLFLKCREDFSDFLAPKALKSLDLYANQLVKLPVSFSQLKSLKWLDLKDNPLCPALKQAAGDCITPGD